MTIINNATFRADETQDSEYSVKGTVEVTIRNETRRVRAVQFKSSGDLMAQGMSGRYQQGAKAWPATVTQRIAADGSTFEFVSFGRDDRSGRFKKENCIFFAD